MNVLKGIVALGLRFFCRRRILGQAQVPSKGGVLILANHRSDCDVIFLQLACRRHISFMAKSPLFEMGKIGKFMVFWQAFAVKQGESDRHALRHAIDLIQDGRVVGVFPEGETSETVRLLPLKPGIALIASQSNCPVVCAGLIGTEGVLPYGKLKPQKSKEPVNVEFGPPFRFQDFDSRESFMAHVKAELLRLCREQEFDLASGSAVAESQDSPLV